MSKKLFSILLVLLLVLSISMMAVACVDPDDDDDGPPIVDPPDTNVISFEEFAKALMQGADALLGNAGAIEETAYAEATLFVSFNDMAAEIHIAATIDEDDLDNNKALVEITVNGDRMLSLYLEDGVIYIGEAITQETIVWSKLGLDPDGVLQKLLSSLLEKLPLDKLADFSLEEFGDSFLFTFYDMLDEYFTITREKDTSAGANVIDGSYNCIIELENLTSLLEILKDFISAEDIRGFIPPNLSGLVDTIVDIIFNRSLDALLGGTSTANFPDISIGIEIKDGALTALGIDYYNGGKTEADEPMAVAFGLKDIAISTNSEKTITPAGLPTKSGIKDAWVKISAGLDVPGKETNLTLDAYINPAVKLLAKDDGFLDTVDLTGVNGYAIATLTLNGAAQAIEIPAKYDGENVIFDLSGLASEAAGTYVFFHPFSLNDWAHGLFAGDEEGDGGPEEAEAVNAIDSLIDVIKEVFEAESLDIMGLLGQLTTVLDIVTEVVGNLEGVATAADKTVDISIFELLEAIANMDVLTGIETNGIGDVIASLDPNTPEEVIVQILALIDFIGGEDGLIDEAELFEYIEDFTGLAIDKEALVNAVIRLTYFRDTTNGLGFSVSILIDDEVAAELTLSIDIVAPPAAGSIPALTENLDLQDELVQEQVIDILKDLLNAFAGKEIIS